MSAEDILTRYIFIGEGRVTEDKSDAVDALLCGDALLFYENLPGYMVLNVRKYDKRSIDEPPLSTVAYGPREGFIEDLKTNLCLVERRIHSPRLAVENLKIGRVTKTDVAVVYLDGVASSELVKRVIKRLESIQADGIMDVQYIQPYLEERPFSVFNQVGRAEKPDIVSAKLLEGRIARLRKRNAHGAHRAVFVYGKRSVQRGLLPAISVFVVFAHFTHDNAGTCHIAARNICRASKISSQHYSAALYDDGDNGA